MAERAEAFDSMVCAHTACTDPAERQILLRNVHDRAVDGDVARGRAVEHLASVRVVVAEVVERKWSGPCVENAIAYDKIATLTDKLAQEKVYLEDEIRTELNFEEIVGSSDALRHVLRQV